MPVARSVDRKLLGLTVGELLPVTERLGISRFRLRVAGNCQSPVGFEVFGEPTIRDRRWRTDDDGAPLILEGEARCRKCDACLQQRARLWAARAACEIRSSSRTWFGTLTLSPDAQMTFLARARRREIRNGVDFDALDYGEQFRCQVAAMGADLTKYFKRVRKQAGPLRYLLVAERHEGGGAMHGFPHFHVLIHEVSPLAPVLKAVLREQWHLGFSRWKLCEHTGAAWYVCKYMAKSAASRIRASKDYGSITPFNLLNGVMEQHGLGHSEPKKAKREKNDLEHHPKNGNSETEARGVVELPVT